MGGKLSPVAALKRAILFVSTPRAVRSQVGVILLGLTLPTFRSYENFAGGAAMAYVAAFGGVISLGLAFTNAHDFDRRAIWVGGSLFAVFAVRFVSFAFELGKRTSTGSPSAPRFLWELYLASSPMWIHSLCMMMGAFMMGRAIRAGEMMRDG
jgi:hypothetical protein